MSNSPNILVSHSLTSNNNTVDFLSTQRQQSGLTAFSLEWRNPQRVYQEMLSSVNTSTNQDFFFFFLKTVGHIFLLSAMVDEMSERKKKKLLHLILDLLYSAPLGTLSEIINMSHFCILQEIYFTLAVDSEDKESRLHPFCS